MLQFERGCVGFFGEEGEGEGEGAMKRALPSQIPAGLSADQEQQLLQQQLQGLREERGPPRHGIWTA